MNTWLIEITGSEYDLEALIKLSPFCNTEIIKMKNRYCLKSKKFDSVSEYDNVKKLGRDLVDILNGLAKLQNKHWKPIKFNGVLRENLNGTTTIFFEAKAELQFEATANGTVVKADGTTDDSKHPSQFETKFTVLSKDTNVQKALRIYGSREESWVDLYIIYEIIEDDLGGSQMIFDNKWSSKNAIQRFKHTANSPKAIGDEARHGKENTLPPQKPMLFSDAKILIKELLDKWINNKI